MDGSRAGLGFKKQPGGYAPKKKPVKEEVKEEEEMGFKVRRCRLNTSG